MNIREFEYMVAIADEGNISKAAHLLGISQPSLSNFLKQEERRLGHKLFSYNKKKMIPTKAGEVYLDFCRQIIDTKKQTYSIIFSQQNLNQQNFTVGFTPHRGADIFARIYPRFVSKYPEVNIKVEEGYLENLRNKLLNKDIDFLIGTAGDVHFNNFKIITDSKESLKLLVPKFHPMSHLADNNSTNIIDVNNFRDTPFVKWGKQSTVSSILENYFKEINMKPTMIYESNNATLIDSMLSCGVGVGFLPSTYCVDSSTRVYFDTEPQLLIYNGVLLRKNEVLTEPQKYLAYLLLTCKKSTSYQIHFNEEAKAILAEFGEDF